MHSASLCFKDAAGSSLYAAYELPSSPTSYLVRVTSEPEGKTLLALRVLLYGPDRSLKREFSGKQIVFHGNALSVIFRSHDDERYLVVASDPAAVGDVDSRVQEAASAYLMATGTAYFSLNFRPRFLTDVPSVAVNRTNDPRRISSDQGIGENILGDD